MRGMLLLAIARSCAPLARPLRRLKTGGAALRASRSTATTDDFVADPAGAARRRARLDAALRDVGLDPASLDDDARLRGSSALRTYRSFVLPKSLGALATAEAPQRAATIANQVAFQAREAVAAHEAWLVNVDRAAAERPAEPPHDLTVILDGLRSGENVGNVIRTCETAGARVLCCGTTPAPPTPAVLKAACNAAPFVDVRREPVPLYDADLPAPLALVFGNELVGVHPDVLAACDGVVSLPTFGVKNSLNVASCAAAAVYEVVRRWRSS
ncbi:hypothetical protein JL721_7849 [Aureococcus anophagefferens]|nr:hypothetical protein JL721_7849 [Aureococcus anophagefferens]